MKEKKDKLLSIVGTVVLIAIIGAIVCGILECLGVNTGIIGGIFSIIPMLFLLVFVVYQIISEMTK